jgi:hypothetical protein
MLNFVMQGLYDIQLTSFVKQECISANVVLHLKKPSQREIEKLLKKLVEVPFSFLLYKIALKLKLLQKKCSCIKNFASVLSIGKYFFGCDI